MVRKRHVSIFTAGIAALMFCLSMASFSDNGSPALAHSGQVSKSGCHKVTATGERHWHEEGTRTVAGECSRVSGKWVPVVEAKPVKVDTVPAANVTGELADMLAAERKEHSRTRIERDQLVKDNAALDAEARAAGHGPRVDARCKSAVRAIVNAETGWLSDAVKVNAETRRQLRGACLNP